VRATTATGRPLVRGSSPYAVLHPFAQALARHDPEQAVLALHRDRAAVRAEHRQPSLDDRGGEVADVVGAGELQRHRGQGGDALGGPLLGLHRRRELLRPREQVGLDLQHPAAELGRPLALGKAAVALGDEVADVLRALGDEHDPSLRVADRHGDERPVARDQPGAGRVREVVALQRHGVDLAGVAGPLEGALHARDARLVQCVRGGREHLEDRPAEELLATATDRREVGVVALDEHEVAVHDHVRRRQRAEQRGVVDPRRQLRPAHGRGRGRTQRRGEALREGHDRRRGGAVGQRAQLVDERLDVPVAEHLVHRRGLECEQPRTGRPPVGLVERAR
jgi:hypothetical protein